MSKWSVLQAAFRGKPDEQSQKASIHRHDGFSFVLNRKKLFWTWEFLHPVYHAVDSEELRAVCLQYLCRADTREAKITFRVKSTVADGFRALLHTLEQADPAAWRVESVRVQRLPGKSTVKKSKQRKPKKKLSSRSKSVLYAAVYFYERSFEPVMPLHDLFTYTLPRSDPSPEQPVPQVAICTREPKKSAGVSGKGILSHLLHGVDNTGNVRVWASECILLRLFMTPSFLSMVKNKSVLELGGGMTGLCGLGLALASECSSVVLTDGHPDCVSNQNVCIEMCQQKYPSIFASRSKRSASLHASLLRWSRNDENGDLRNLYYAQGSGNRCDTIFSGDIISPARSAPFRTFDVILASDCLFFKDFHQDLYWLIKKVTVPGSIVFMLQPPRSGTMQLFLDLVAAENCFKCDLSSDYIPEVTRKHKEYLAEDREGIYNPDIHYATLVKLTRL